MSLPPCNLGEFQFTPCKKKSLDSNPIIWRFSTKHPCNMKILHKTPLTSSRRWRGTPLCNLFIFLKPDTCVTDTDVAHHCVIILILIFKNWKLILKIRFFFKKNEKIWIEKFRKKLIFFYQNIKKLAYIIFFRMFLKF